MPSYDRTALWQNSLATKTEDEFKNERERLRIGYEHLRERAKILSEYIAKDLPDLTVHDISHSDSLWEYADLIAGKTYPPISPCEAFVLGGAFLLHDLGLGLAAYPDGKESLKKLPIWQDTVASILREAGEEEITPAKINQANENVEKQALFIVLRKIHAQKSETLAFTKWGDPDNPAYLIQEDDLRNTFGALIGRIAHSHWWSIEEVAKELNHKMGAPPKFPQDWTIDTLKLACLLRSADLCHIDGSRAPYFARAICKPAPKSKLHWQFQEKLYQPRIDIDRLIYTSKDSFKISEAPAWWTCFDYLQGIDRELHGIDSLLADTARVRLLAKGVSQSENPSRLSKLVRPDGWQPIDTRIKVSAVAKLISTLGGNELYGNRLDVPIREMIQNGADAIKARRVIDNKSSNWGEIKISLGTDSLGKWLQIEDTGVGMSEAVLTGPLLDFGVSFWGSTLMHDEFPGLEAKGFRPIGKYGIGFFSIFMLGKQVQVTTQRFDRSRSSETLILEFNDGIEERPLLRNANPEECLSESGTRIKVWFKSETAYNNLFPSDADGKKLTLSETCCLIAPCLDVSLKIECDGTYQTIIEANDWLTIDDETLIKRIAPKHFNNFKKKTGDTLEGRNFLEIIKDQSGQIIGRAAICPDDEKNIGIVTVGGCFACIIGNMITGVLVGRPSRAARDYAMPIIQKDTLQKWAQEHSTKIKERIPPEQLIDIGLFLYSLGIFPHGYPITKTSEGIIGIKEINELVKQYQEINIVNSYELHDIEKVLGPVKLRGGVLLDISNYHGHILEYGRYLYEDWPRSLVKPRIYKQMSGFKAYIGELEELIIEIAASNWGVSMEQIINASVIGEEDETSSRIIGTADGKDITRNVNIIRNPGKLISN